LEQAGVYVAAGTFKKSPAAGAANSGIIRGSDDTEDPNIASVSGAAVYVSSVGVRNTTAGQAVSLDSTLSGATGGWE
jgi:hypothetical protein